MGHFRSTIIGNFIANIHQVLGHNVIRINWLGDWGTQFGLLAFGLKDQNVQEFHDPIHQLFHIYVDINRDELSLRQDLEAYVINDNSPLPPEFIIILAVSQCRCSAHCSFRFPETESAISRDHN